MEFGEIGWINQKHFGSEKIIIIFFERAGAGYSKLITSTYLNVYIVTLAPKSKITKDAYSKHLPGNQLSILGCKVKCAREVC